MRPFCSVPFPGECYQHVRAEGHVLRRYPRFSAAPFCRSAPHPSSVARRFEVEVLPLVGRNLLAVCDPGTWIVPERLSCRTVRHVRSSLQATGKLRKPQRQTERLDLGKPQEARGGSGRRVYHESHRFPGRLVVRLAMELDGSVIW
jgi:hypothetical protein